MIAQDTNVEILARGPVPYNGHLLTYSLTGKEWSMKCAACGAEMCGPSTSATRFHERRAIFWLYQARFFSDECNSDYDEMGEIVAEEMQQFVGRVANAGTEQQVENALGKRFSSPVNVSIGR